MTTLKILAVAGVAGWLLFGNHAQAQILVTDGASIAQSALNQAQTIAQWTMQIQHMVEQIESMEREYEALTGGRCGRTIKLRNGQNS